MVYRRATGSTTALATLQRVEATGKREPLQAKPGMYSALRLSPDGRQVALTVSYGPDQDIFVYDLERDVMTRLTFGGGQYVPKGRTIRE